MPKILRAKVTAIATFLTAMNHRADATQFRLKLSDFTRFSWEKNWGEKSVLINLS